MKTVSIQKGPLSNDQSQPARLPMLTMRYGPSDPGYGKYIEAANGPTVSRFFQRFKENFFKKFGKDASGNRFFNKTLGAEWMSHTLYIQGRVIDRFASRRWKSDEVISVLPERVKNRFISRLGQHQDPIKSLAYMAKRLKARQDHPGFSKVDRKAMMDNISIAMLSYHTSDEIDDIDLEKVLDVIYEDLDKPLGPLTRNWSAILKNADSPKFSKTRLRRRWDDKQTLKRICPFRVKRFWDRS